MKVCIQRVKSASVTVENEVIAKIGQGLLVLVGIGREDTMEQAKVRLHPSSASISDMLVRRIVATGWLHLHKCIHISKMSRL